MEGGYVSSSSIFALILLLAGGVGHVSNQSNHKMKFSIDSLGVYGSAAPLVLEVDEAGLACASNLSHDLQQDMTQRVFTGIGSKCLKADGDIQERLDRLASIVGSQESPEPGRGVHFIQFTLADADGYKQLSGRLALSPRTAATSEAAQLFYSLHHEVSVKGDLQAALRPELRLHDGTVVELLLHNTGTFDAVISSPREWKDSHDPTVPRVTANIWGAGRSTVAVLDGQSWRERQDSAGPLEIPAGETISLNFDLPEDSREEIRLVSGRAQIAGGLRFNVQFGNGLAGMATAAIDPTEINL